MAERQADEAIQHTGTVMKRRGLIAGAAAMVAGMVAKQASEPVAALSGTGSTGALILQSNSLGSADQTTFPNTPNVASAATDLDASANFGNYAAYGAYIFRADARPSAAGNINGLEGYARGTGVGVLGDGNGGMTGTGAVGVQGQNAQYGVVGKVNNAANTVAVLADNQSAGTMGYGVQATSAKWHGVYAECGTDQGAGALVGVTNVATGVAFQARANSPAVAAGFFVGNVSVFGGLGVSGGKFAVVKGADGKHRGMYALESPECWFEDVGTAKLVGGTATVTFDPLFAQHVHTDAYHVFLTPDADSKGLYVASKSATGFVVREQQGGTSSLTFSWRVLGKRNDIAGERLPVWEMPPGADLPASPPPVASPPPPAPPLRPASSPVAVPQGSGTQTPVHPAPPSRP